MEIGEIEGYIDDKYGNKNIFLQWKALLGCQ